MDISSSRNFESKVSKICRKARGERVNLHWQQQIATWGQVGLLLGVVGISAIWPLSIKTVMYSLACTAFAVGIPVQRKLYKEAHSRLCIISFDEKTAARVRSWRLRQNVAAVFATVLMVVGMVWLSWIMFFEFIPDVRESAREHEQTVAELRIRRLLPSGQ